VREILTIGKVCWEVRESMEGRADWDLVVVDAAATGHVVAQLGAAGAIRDLVAVGPVRGQTEWMSELLADPAITALNVVTTPEEMPIETIDLVGRPRELDVRSARSS
jgi:anion-transporting  ArsA/GET3 family ATPase